MFQNEPKVKFTKNNKGEIVGVEINESITEKELIKHFIKPEVDNALSRQKEEFRGIIEKRKIVLRKLIEAHNLDIDKHRLDELQQFLKAINKL